MNIDNAANITVAAMAIGIANAALGAFRELAPRKKLPNGEILAESALGKIVLANTQSTLAQARGHLYETVETMSEQMADCDVPGRGLAAADVTHHRRGGRRRYRRRHAALSRSGHERDLQKGACSTAACATCSRWVRTRPSST